MSVVLICEPGLVMLIFSESKQSPQKITKKIPDYQQLLCSVFCNLQYTFNKYLWNSSLFTVKIIKPPGMNTVTSFLQIKKNKRQLWHCYNVERTKHFFSSRSSRHWAFSMFLIFTIKLQSLQTYYFCTTRKVSRQSNNVFNRHYRITAQNPQFGVFYMQV